MRVEKHVHKIAKITQQQRHGTAKGLPPVTLSVELNRSRGNFLKQCSGAAFLF